MATTTEELNAFNHFAQAKITQNESTSLSDLFQEWLREKERLEVLDSVRKSNSEYEEGLGIPAEEAMAWVREKMKERA